MLKVNKVARMVMIEGQGGIGDKHVQCGQGGKGGNGG